MALPLCLDQRSGSTIRTAEKGLFVGGDPSVIGSRGNGLRSPRGTCARRVGVAITVTGLKIALQSGPQNLYDTSHRSILYSGPTSAMDEPRAGDVPLVD